MSYLTGEFVTRDEYIAHEDNRLHGDQLKTRKLYVAMFSLINNPQEEDAAKVSARIEGILKEPAEDTYLATITLFNLGMRPAYQRHGIVISHGYWVDVRRRGVAINHIIATEAFLVDKNNPPSKEPDAETSAKIIPISGSKPASIPVAALAA
jgi:hypothetical protein